MFRLGQLWHRGCSSLGGATRYQVVNSTDGVSGYQGEEGNHKITRRYRLPTTVAPFILIPKEIFGDHFNRQSHGWVTGAGSVVVFPASRLPFQSPMISKGISPSKTCVKY